MSYFNQRQIGELSKLSKRLLDREGAVRLDELRINIFYKLVESAWFKVMPIFQCVESEYTNEIFLITDYKSGKITKSLNALLNNRAADFKKTLFKEISKKEYDEICNNGS